MNYNTAEFERAYGLHSQLPASEVQCRKKLVAQQAIQSKTACKGQFSAGQDDYNKFLQG